MKINFNQAISKQYYSPTNEASLLVAKELSHWLSEFKGDRVYWRCFNNERLAEFKLEIENLGVAIGETTAKVERTTKSRPIETEELAASIEKELNDESLIEAFKASHPEYARTKRIEIIERKHGYCFLKTPLMQSEGIPAKVWAVSLDGSENGLVWEPGKVKKCGKHVQANAISDFIATKRQLSLVV